MLAFEECQLTDIQGRVARRGGLVNVHQPTNQPRPNIGPCHRCFQDAQEYTLHPQPWPLPVPAIHLPTTNTSKCSNFNCKEDYETPNDEWLTAHTCLGSPARGKSAHFEGRKASVCVCITLLGSKLKLLRTFYSVASLHTWKA